MTHKPTLAMTNNDDTICAISTPAGIGGIAVARISGPDAVRIADTVWHGKTLSDAISHTAHLGNIVDPQNNETLDQAVATIFRAPRSFTGDDVVEFSVHGSIWIQTELINLLIRQGCRPAEPGEFTMRAFASGKMDLAEAEAVADVIASTSRASHRVAMSQMRGHFSSQLGHLRDQLLELASLLELELDFSEEDVEFADRRQLLDLSQTTLQTVERLAESFSTGDAIRRGIPVAIIGEPNVGKSTILNALLGDNRAIVSDIPGTTRDTIEDTADINGMTFRFIDTAGLRQTTDQIENLGIERAWEKTTQAKIILWVITPQSTPSYLRSFHKELTSKCTTGTTILPVLNKSDLLATQPQKQTTPLPDQDLATIPPLPISALNNQGIDNLKNELHHIATASIPHAADTPDAVIVTNARHYSSLLSAATSLRLVIDGLTTNLPGDLVAQDVRETLHHLSTITGTITTDAVLESIFTNFCIGK